MNVRGFLSKGRRKVQIRTAVLSIFLTNGFRQVYHTVFFLLQKTFTSRNMKYIYELTPEGSLCIRCSIHSLVYTCFKRSPKRKKHLANLYTHSWIASKDGIEMEYLMFTDFKREIHSASHYPGNYLPKSLANEEKFLFLPKKKDMIFSQETSSFGTSYLSSELVTWKLYQWPAGAEWR